MPSQTLPLVQAADDMDADHLLLHLQHRHPESLVDNVSFFVSDYVEECYRRFHEKLHEFRTDINHQHEGEL